MIINIMCKLLYDTQRILNLFIFRFCYVILKTGLVKIVNSSTTTFQYLFPYMYDFHKVRAKKTVCK